MLKGGLKFHSAAAIALLLACAVAMNAQAQNRRNRGNNNNSNANTSAADSGHAFKASEVNGLAVHTANNEEKGKIKDLMISGNGRVEYAVVSFGGFLGVGNKLFAVPLDAIHFEWKDNKINYATVDVSEETIKERQGFDENNWPEHADRGFLSNGGTGSHARTTRTTATTNTQ